jgi:hypothetical protein
MLNIGCVGVGGPVVAVPASDRDVMNGLCIVNLIATLQLARPCFLVIVGDDEQAQIRSTSSKNFVICLPKDWRIRVCDGVLCKSRLFFARRNGN